MLEAPTTPQSGSRVRLGLLLLPSVVLAMMAVASLWNDRRAALGEATDRARELAGASTREAARVLAEVLAYDGRDSAEALFDSNRAPWKSGRVRIGASGQLQQPSPRVWPPVPQPFEADGAGDFGVVWNQGISASANRRWAEAANCFGQLDSSPNLDRRRRLNARWLRVLALTESDTPRAAEALGPLWDEVLATEAPVLSESGVSVAQLAVWHGLTRFADAGAAFPTNWLKRREEWLAGLADSPGGALLDSIAARMEPLAILCASDTASRPARGDPTWWRQRIRAVFDEAETRRAVGARLAMEKPKALAVLMVKDLEILALPGPASGDGSAEYGLVNLGRLSRELESVMATDGGKGFVQAWEVLGEGIALRGGLHPLPHGALALGTPATLPHGIRLQVHVGLADPEKFFSTSRRRQWLLGGLGLGALAMSVAGAVAMDRALARQRALAVRQANFIASVSHELRAPIAGVQLLAEGLESDRAATPAERREFAQLIGRECRRLTALIENVLNLGRIERGQKRYAFEPMDLRALVTETVSLMQPLARQADVGLRLELPPESIDAEIEGDGGALQQALTNLIDNALKHAPPDSTVRVSLEVAASSNALSIRVSDSGLGVPLADRERIFEAFQRTGSELRRSTTGIGIGLTLARHAARAHDGDIVLEELDGGGACFVLRLPRRPAALGGAA